MCRTREPAKIADGWEPWGSLATGWAGFVCHEPLDPITVPEPWDSLAGPVLVASVVDGGFCVMTGAVNGTVVWHHVINEDNFVGEVPASVADAVLGNRARATEALTAWARAAELPRPDGLGEILDSGYIQAETGFHDFLDAFGLLMHESVQVLAVEFAPLPEPVTEPARPPMFSRAARLALEVDTYLDLRTRLEAVAQWLDDVRQTIVVPAVAQADRVLDVDPRDSDEVVAPGTLLVQVNSWSVKRRFSTAIHDERAWQRLRRRLLKGELRTVGISLVQYSETARAFAAGGDHAWITVDLRSIHVDNDTGPLPNGYPAQFVVEIDEAWDGAPDRVAYLRELLRSTATTFEAAYGYLSSDRAGMTGAHEVTISPYEQRSGAHTHPARRLNEITRGVHWCTVLGPRHVEAIGGPEVLRDPATFHRAEPLGESGQWLVQLTAEPGELTHAAVDRAAWALRAVMPRRLSGNIGLTAEPLSPQ